MKTFDAATLVRLRRRRLRRVDCRSSRRTAPARARRASSPIRPPTPTTMRCGWYHSSRYDDERLARRAAHGLLAADDVPAERLVAVEELLVDAADEVARRVEVHVHLLDDHALLALDLLGVEARVAQHVDEHVERDVAMLGRALDVVGGVLLAGERVELAADRVDLACDVARARPALRALEEHVLGEVRDAVRLRRLVARACGEHDHAGDRLRLRHRRGQHAQAVVEDVRSKVLIAVSLLRQRRGSRLLSARS